MPLYRRPMLSYDVAMTVWLVGLFAVLSVTHAFSAAKVGDRWRRSRIIELNSEGQSSSTDVQGLNELNEAPATILTNDVDENPSTDKSKKSSDLRRNLKDIVTENGRKLENDDKEEEEEFDDEDQLNRDYVDVARSTNAFALGSRRAVASSAGPLKVVVDLLIVVDNKLYRRTLQRQNTTKDAHNYIKKYYKYVVTLVDFAYSQINDSELTIRVRLAGTIIAKNKSASPWSENHVLQDGKTLNVSGSLEEFGEWLKETYATLPKFDHAMAFTGYPLTKKTAGLANVETICLTADGYSSSIVWETGGLTSVFTAIHELGHSLGSEHDGKDSTSDCPAEESYIMAPKLSKSVKYLKNYFLFSSCTIRQFKSVLGSDAGKCLFDSVPDKITLLPGQKVSPDDRCKEFVDQNSSSCKKKNDKQPPERICIRLYCLYPVDDSCVRHSDLTPVLGSECGEGKVCNQGECMDKTTVWKLIKSLNQFSTSTEKPPKQKSVDRNARGIQVRDIIGKTFMPEDTYARDKTV